MRRTRSRSACANKGTQNRHLRRGGAGLLATALALTGTAMLSESAAAVPADGGLRWDRCYHDVQRSFDDFGKPYECTKVRVPIDYDDPSAGTMRIAMTRIAAADQANKRGTIFLNPGGPGGSGIEFLLFWGPFAEFDWGPIANEYDLVGFDPRGISRSKPLRCFRNLDDAFSVFPPTPFPSTEEDVALFQAMDERLNQRCDKYGHPMLGHMSTGNVARDLDVMRTKVGDDKLNFVGLSYGTYVGQVYANMYPDNVGAMVIDGVLDPIAWTNADAQVPFSNALRSDIGARATLDEFIRQCDAAGPELCAIAPNAFDTVQGLIARLREAPILIRDPETGERFPYEYSFLVGDLLGAMYNPYAFPDFAGFLAFLEAQLDDNNPFWLGRARAELYEAIGITPFRGFPKYENIVEGFPGVACAETNNPTDYNAVFVAGKQATADHGLFGELWNWAGAPCSSWDFPDHDAYTGPYATTTATPMLVIGNFYDPATRFKGALTAHDLLDNSALISVDEPGHTSLGLSPCAGFLTGQYLTDPHGYAAANAARRCPSGGNWFEKLGQGPGPGDGLRADYRRAVLDEVAFRP